MITNEINEAKNNNPKVEKDLLTTSSVKTPQIANNPVKVNTITKLTIVYDIPFFKFVISIFLFYIFLNYLLSGLLAFKSSNACILNVFCFSNTPLLSFKISFVFWMKKVIVLETKKPKTTNKITETIQNAVLVLYFFVMNWFTFLFAISVYISSPRHSSCRYLLI